MRNLDNKDSLHSFYEMWRKKGYFDEKYCTNMRLLKKLYSTERHIASRTKTHKTVSDFYIKYNELRKFSILSEFV